MVDDEPKVPEAFDLPIGEKTQPGIAAKLALRAFINYYHETREFSELAKKAFENRDHATSLKISRQRLALYNKRVLALVSTFQTNPSLAKLKLKQWVPIETNYIKLITDWYEADLAWAFLQSFRRRIFESEWHPMDYAFIRAKSSKQPYKAKIHLNFRGGRKLTSETVINILKIAKFAVDYENIERDAILIANKVNSNLANLGSQKKTIQIVQMVDAGFYRNRGVYLIGRIILSNKHLVPFIIALLNGERGIYVDAVLNSESDPHNVFSSTLANFHVTNRNYHEICGFLKSIMPERPSGLHYSTIGFNHMGKVAVINELRDHFSATTEFLDIGVGFQGTVAIGFSSPSCAYALKVIRDKPTKNYKWGAFKGIDTVLEKYKRIHEINRTGSMLDNIIYYNIKLNLNWFESDFLENLLDQAGNTVSVENKMVFFRHLIVQRKVIPLPVFLDKASPKDAETVILNLGQCIRNNAAANVFNRDLDGRNYGVSRFLKVFLFDYDAIEPFTHIKIRTNSSRIDGEEDIPDWFFEDGVIFLPEEIESGLRILDRSLLHFFRTQHSDLLSVNYWKGVQDDLLAGKVTSVSTYPESRKLV